jgi:TolA-binding protein
MSREVPAEDLLVLARQCQLSEEEERRFEIATQSSRELECLYNAGLHFDNQAGLLSGDEKRFSRLVERALERIDQAQGASGPRATNAALPAASRPSRASLVGRYFAVSLGFGILLCVTLASAWDYVEKRAAQQAEQAQSARKASAGAVVRRKPKLAAPTPAPSATAVPQLPSLATESPHTDTSASAPHPLAIPVGPARKLALTDEPLSASELFARANQARRTGDVEDAISLYERLGRAYPGSIEAEDAKIFRGNLLLSQRSPRAALRQFEDYHSGELSLEALWGRAQALRKLESPEERAILLELVRLYPGSPYAQAAEKRLRELGH